MMLRTLPRSFFYYLITGIFISGLAFVNHYPLVYSDSGAYIANSFSLFPNDDRPIGYGLLIRAVTWQSTMWTVVVFQGFVASWLLMLMVRATVSGPERWTRIHLLLLAALVLGSSLPWYSAQLMADHYTPLVLIIAFLLFRAKGLGPWREGGLWILLFFFLATHNAHFPMCGALSLLTLLSVWRSPGKRSSIFWRKWAGFNAVLVGSAVLVMSFNYSAYGQFRLSRAGNVFLAGRLCEPGIMADYLDKVCPIRETPLCAYRGRLPEDAGQLLWSPDQMVNAEHLTIGQADSILAPVVSDVLCRPEYLGRYLRSAVVSTAVQLFQWDAGTGLGQYGTDSSPYGHLARHLPQEMHSYMHSRQQWDYWAENKDVNRLCAMVLILSLLVIMVHWSSGPDRAVPLLRGLTLWVVAWIVLNAAVTSSLSVVDPRLQSRVMWLLPMVALLILVEQRSLRDFFRFSGDR